MLYGIETQQIVLIVLVVLLVLVLIVMPIFTNKKRQQSVNTLHNSLKVGDKVMTIGGIIGTVVDIKQTSAVDKEFTIETGEEGKKTTMVLDIKALYQIMSASGAAPAVAPVAKTENEIKAETDVTSVFEEVAPEPEEVKAEPAAEEVAEEKVEEKAEEPVAETEVKPEEPVAAKPAAKPRSTAKKNSTKK